MKITGYKCDVCPTMSEEPDRPDHWLSLRLPGGGAIGTRDFCSDKCLLYFARQRVGTTKKSVSARRIDPGLAEFLDKNGVRTGQRGASVARHVRGRHEMGMPTLDCLICQYLSGGEK